MQFPWISRKLFELTQEVAEERKETIAELRQQNAELKALFNKTSQFEVVEQQEDRITLKSKSVMAASGRGGWRNRRAEQESQTVPVPEDSMQALERRIAEQK